MDKKKQFEKVFFDEVTRLENSEVLIMNKEVIKEIRLSLFYNNIELMCYKKETIINEVFDLENIFRFELYDRRYFKRKTIYLHEKNCKDIATIVNVLIYYCRKEIIQNEKTNI